jgi:hypothetical protein
MVSGVIDAFDVDEPRGAMLRRRWISPPWKSLVNPEFDPYIEQTERKQDPRNAEHDRL